MSLTRAAWIEAALEALASEGLAGVAVGPLARRLAATKGSFYWHFNNRDELIAATLRLWIERDTDEVIAAIEAIADPQDRLRALAQQAYGDAAAGKDAHASVLAAATDPRIGPALADVTQRRLDFLERLFSDLGNPRHMARTRAHLAYAVYVGVADLRRALPLAAPSKRQTNASIDLLLNALLD